MNLKLLQKSITPLFLATLVVGVFYWQFTKVYPFIIERFTEDKLSILYGHLLIYIFLIQTLFVSFANFLNNILIKSKVFVIVTILVFLVFYALSYTVLKDILEYFMLSNPLEESSMIAMIFFVVGTLGYSLYSMGILFFKKLIPYSYILVFTLLALAYSAWFIDSYCYPIEEFSSKFEWKFI